MQIIMNAKEMERSIERLAYQVLENHSDIENLLLIGIVRRGVPLSKRLATVLRERTKKEIDLGTLDISLYRDDWTTLTNMPSLSSSQLPFSLEGKSIILVDDVLYSGRTTRAALEALSDFGRPKSIELLVLMDRGHRELPIMANYTGKTVETLSDEHINVLVEEIDGKDEVQRILSKA